jgi:CPA2 family monovalent cation:H+ antiporter-2
MSRYDADMHNIDLILTLTGGLAVALVCGYITQRIGLSPIVGYLLAGIVVSPNTPGIEADPELAAQMAEIGVILLMFGVGLHFHLSDLLAVRRVAIPGAIGQSIVATLLGMAVAMWFGWPWSAGLVFGLAISVASTVVLLRVLADYNDLHTPAGHIAVGWLVVEDLFTVLVLVLLPVVFNAEAVGATQMSIALVWSLLKIALFVGFVFVVGGRVMPWILTQISATRSRELFTLTVLVLALGIAVGAAKLFGVSMALGAFLAGMVVGQSDFSSRAASEALPMRDAFAVLFFVSVGMLVDPLALFESPTLVAATLAIILIAKPLSALIIVLLLRYPLRVGLSVGVALAQIGEFSFILASLGKDIGIFSEELLNALIAAAILSISANPLIYRTIDYVEGIAKKSPRLWAMLNAPVKFALPVQTHDEEDVGRRDQAVVVGYGPVGRTLCRLLRENDIEPTVIDLNINTVRRLREEGMRAIYGDATHKETMHEAGTKEAVVFILSSAGMHGSDEAIRLAREVNPSIRVLARATYLREVPLLRHAGADAVFSSEGEVAIAMNEFMLRQLGATEEQIDRQNDRIRDELFGNHMMIEVLAPPPQPASASAEHGELSPDVDRAANRLPNTTT